ncbi:MAG: ABC transporter ATP-binding protein [Ghiorsea sp.]
MFSVSNICKSYPTPQGPLNVLDHVSLHVKQGSFTAIIGESGSGKSTLLQLLGTLDYADSGEIHLNKKPIHHLKENELAKLRNQQIGFIYQSHHLIPELTALENTILPLLIQGIGYKESVIRAQALLEELGLKDRESHIPAHLSGGEAQRVAVARAIITQPKLILADEPTGNLDEMTAHTVFNMMRELCKSQKVAVIMVTHSRIFANACDDVYELSEQTLSLSTS